MLELDGDFLGKKMECVGAGISGGGPPGAHETGGAPYRGGLLSRGLVLAPPIVFSVPKILKYSRKNHTKFAGHLEHFYFQTFFYCTDNSENRRIILFLLYLI